MKRLLFILFIGITGIGFGQSQLNIEWEKKYEGNLALPAIAESVEQTSDGGYIIGGFMFQDLTSDSDYWIKKINSTGIVEWETLLGGSGTEYLKSIDLTLDNGYILAGESTSNDGDVNYNYGNRDNWIVKLDSSGNIEWTQSIGGVGNEEIQKIKQLPSGDYLLSSFTASNDPNFGCDYSGDFWLSKLDQNGIILWSQCYGGSSQDVPRDMKLTSDGGCIIVGETSSSDGDVTIVNGGRDFWCLKINGNGDLIWQKSFGGSLWDEAFSVIETDLNEYVIAGSSESSNGDLTSNNGGLDFWIIKIDQQGNLIWQKSFGGSLDDEACSVRQSVDGGYLVLGTTHSNDIDVIGSNGNRDFWIIKLNPDGTVQWTDCLGGSDDETARDLYACNDGGYIAVGGSLSGDGDISEPNNGYFDFWVVKFNHRGVGGRIYNDFNNNCIQETLEPGLNNFNLFIQPGDLILTSDINGNWFIDSLEEGNYSVNYYLPSVNWSTNCLVQQNFTVINSNTYTSVENFGLINNSPCTEPYISVFAPSLRRCFSDRLIYVSACNELTATGILDSSFIDVELDPLLTVNSASLPYTDLGNNTFRFETGDIYPGQCVNFTLSTTVSCDAQNGQTLCMNAILYPAEDCVFDSIPSDPVTNDGLGGTLDGLPGPCTLPWDKSSLSVEGWCQGDSVYFSVTNTGDFGDGDMECYSPVWLTVDGVVTDTDSLQIQGGETVIYSYPASGQTFILNASQHPLHPGNSAPNAHVELCGDSTNWTPGIINQFPQDDADPDIDIYCGQVTAPFDPNDKTGYPLGQTEEYYIQPNQQLQYVIRFQNVGTDTAFTVVVRDTLDIDLNIFTVTPGVASHPYTFKMYGPRVLEWTFEDIQLPDSTTNSEGSNGFLTFHVEQVPDLAPGTVINNDADIYFDFELPITTNTTVHKIFDGFVSVLNVEDLTIEGKDILIYPNPTTNLITIQSESVLNNTFKIYDQQGREVINGKLTGKNTKVSLGKLSRGTYTIQVDGNYKPAVIIKE